MTQRKKKKVESVYYRKWRQAIECIHERQVSIFFLHSHFLPSKEVTWKQKRRSSLSTAMTEQLSRSVTSPPATSPRPCCIRLPPCVKKYWRSQDVDTSPVLLRDTQKSYFDASDDNKLRVKIIIPNLFLILTPDTNISTTTAQVWPWIFESCQFWQRETSK